MGAGEGMKPVAAMVLIQVVFAGVNIFYKLAVCDGMDMRVLVAYRYLFASAVLAPLAYFVERKKRTKLTWRVVVLSFICGLSGWLLAGAEPVHLQHEANVGDLRVRHDQPHPGHHLRPRRALPLREAGDPDGVGAGQGDGHGARRRRRHAAHLLQGRRDHAMGAPHRPRRQADAPRRSRAPGSRVEQPRGGVAAGHRQLLLLRAVAHPAGEAEPGVPVPLLEHGAPVRHGHGAVRGVRALLRQGRGAVAAWLRHQAPLRRVLGRPGVWRDAGGAFVVREAEGSSVRVGVQPADAAGGGRAELSSAGRAAAPRERAGRGVHRDGAVRGAVGERPRDGDRGGQGRRGGAHRRGGTASAQHDDDGAVRGIGQVEARAAVDEMNWPRWRQLPSCFGLMLTCQSDRARWGWGTHA